MATEDDAAARSGTAFPAPPPVERPLPSGRRDRPGSLLWGCIMTWVGAVYGLVMSLFLVIALAPDVGRPESSRTTFLVIGGLQAIWCLLAFGFAVFAFQGRRWAVYALAGLAAFNVVLLPLGPPPDGRLIVATAYSALAATLVFVGFRRWRLGEP